MADDQGTPGDKPAKVDVADLKARLGLKKKAQEKAEAAKAKVHSEAADERAADAASGEPEDAGVDADSVAEARRRAEAAMAEAGTSAESFDTFDQDRTPVPQALPSAPVTGTEALEGQGRSKTIRTAVVLVIVAALGVGLGNMLGSATERQALVDAYASTAKRKLQWFRDQSTSSGAKTLDAIAGLKEALDAAVADIDAVEAKGGDPLKLEQTFKVLLPTLQAFRDDRAYFSAKSVAEDLPVTMANGGLLPAVDFALGSEVLWVQVTAAIDEAVQYAKLSRPAGAAKRTLLVEAGEREVEGQKIPTSTGAWVADTGKPAQVNLVDEQNPANNRQQWQMMVLKVGGKDPVQVPTTQVLSVDLEPVYTEQIRVVRMLNVDRLAAITRKLDELAGGLAWPNLEQKLQEWAAKAP